MKYYAANLDPQLHPSNKWIRKILAKANVELIEKECTTEHEVLEFAGNADALIAAKAPLNRTVIQQLTHCKVIARPGAGTDNVDHEAATDHNIVVVYVPDFCAEDVSNHALMFILACNKKLARMDRYVRQGNWGFELLAHLPTIKDQILGLVGFGRIARCLAQKAQALKMKILACDPFVPTEVFGEHNANQGDLEQILKGSDYVSLHIPLTNKTARLIGAEQLKMMKPSAYLINCARGAIVDEQALINALKQKTIAGAALDCFAVEPPQKENPLFNMENVILTPHSAAYSESAIEYLRKKTFTQVAEVLMGRKPEFIRNPEVLQQVKLV